MPTDRPVALVMRRRKANRSRREKATTQSPGLVRFGSELDREYQQPERWTHRLQHPGTRTQCRQRHTLHALPAPVATVARTRQLQPRHLAVTAATANRAISFVDCSAVAPCPAPTCELAQCLHQLYSSCISTHVNFWRLSSQQHACPCPTSISVVC